MSTVQKTEKVQNKPTVTQKGSAVRSKAKVDLTGPTPTRRFKHKQGAVFGTSIKQVKLEDSPGPGNYEPLFSKVSTKMKTRDVVILSSKDRYSYIASAKSPGPGHYEEKGDPRVMQSSRGASRGSGFSLSMRKTEIDNVIAQSARGPGPGQYTHIEAVKKDTGHTIGVKRVKRTNICPGPGAYNVEIAEEARRAQTAKVNLFGQTRRPDIWREDQKKSNLGPGYENMRSSFDQSNKKGPSMGAKIASKALKTPGPGQYDNDNANGMSKAKGVSTKIASGPKRPDHFVSKKQAENPGPGNYDGAYQVFGKNVKSVANMGSKYKTEHNANPGPGQYSAEPAGRMQAAKSNCKIGTQARPDIWAKDTKIDMPGPGNYLETGSFGQNTKSAANMGSKHRQVKNTNPGPGQYDPIMNKTMRPTSTYGKMGTTKRTELFNTKEGMPGPGHHSQSYSSFANAKVNNFGASSARKTSKNGNPGPGQYSEHGRNMTHTKSASVQFGSTNRPDLWKKEVKGDVPGPGGYEDETNTFGKAVKGGASMGSKYKPERNLNPGPGQYDADPSRVNANNHGSMRIGQQPRVELWQGDTKTDVPGPGGYQDETNTFGKAVKGGASNMGRKYKAERNLNPGPGQYDADPSKVQVNNHGSVHIGQEKRKDIWDGGINDVPGPGGYEDETNTFGKAVKGGANMGSKYKPERNNNPGPAQYEVSDSLTKKAGTGQRISKAQRKEIWESQMRKDVPGPGNYQENTSSFSQIKGNANMGSKYRENVDLNPGPGQYEQALYDMSNHQVVNGKIGSEKVPNDLFNVEQARSVPGPGTYESPDKQGKGFTIGAKRSDRIVSTPGVGTYNVENASQQLGAKEASVKFSQAKREDNFRDDVKAQMPGPGAVDLHDLDSPNAGFQFSKDERFPQKKETAPGPGAYELLDD